MLITRLLTTRMTMAACNGLMKAGVMVIRRRNKQIETFVNMRVANVLFSSQYAVGRHSVVRACL